MDTFGEKLRSEREHRGLSIQAVAEVLGVDHDRLRALERNDFEALPDKVIMVECLRAYAECLRVDAELMIEDYVREREKCLRQLADALPMNRRPRLELILAASAVVVTIAILGAWWILSRDEIASSGMPAEPAAPPQISIDRPLSVPPTSSEAPSKPSMPTTSDTSALSVSDHGVGTSVQGRRLVGRNDRFTEGTQVWFWTRVEGGNRGDVIEHVWLRDGVEALRIPLRIGGASWRTYSAKMLPTAGNWAVEARDDTGRVMARSEFACVR